MKILISRSSGGTVGGAEYSARDQAIVLRELGHDVIVMTRLKAIRQDLHEIDVSTRMTIYLQRFPGLIRYLYFAIFLPIKIVTDLISILSVKPDILNPHTREDQVIQTLLKPIHRKPVVWKDPGDLVFQLWEERSNPLGKIYQAVLIAAIKRADYIYTLNDEHTKHIRKFLDSKTQPPITNIPSSILYDHYDLNAATIEREKSLVLGFVGGLFEGKGIRFLLQAFKELKHVHPDMELWIAGDGDLREELEREAESIDDVYFLGYQDDVSSFMNSIDIFVQPAITEGWGRNIKEAMYFGKAIAGSNTGGIAAQIEHGKTGLLFEPKKATSIVKTLKPLIEDAELRRPLGQAAQAKATHDGDFRYIVQNQILPIYEQVLKSKGVPTEIAGNIQTLADPAPVSPKLNKRPLKVAIESQSLMGSRTGIGMYLYGLLRGLEKVDSETDYSLIVFNFLWRKFRAPISFATENFGYKFIWMIPGRVFNLFLKRDILFPLDLLINNRRIYFFPNFVRWPLVRSKSVIVVHDLSFEHFPEYTEEKNLAYMKKFVPRSVEKATHIVTDSEYTKQDIVTTYMASPKKITVIYPGLNHEQFYPRSEIDIARAKKTVGVSKKYLLFIGSLEPRKNIVGMIEAYAALPQQLKDEYQLVLAGGKGWKDEGINHALKTHEKEDILLPGYVNERHKAALISGASLFLYPTHFEGFGIPPIEAMACATPVIAADNSSIPEAVGDAAIMVDSRNTEQLTHEIARVLTSNALQEQLIAKGLKQAAKFQWEDSAQQLIKIFKKLHDSNE